MKMNNEAKAAKCATDGNKNFNAIEDSKVIKDTRRINPGDNGHKLNFSLFFNFVK